MFCLEADSAMAGMYTVDTISFHKFDNKIYYIRLHVISYCTYIKTKCNHKICLLQVR